MKLYDTTFDVLATSLNLRSLNQNVISSNVTNADTPNFKSRRMEFDKEFQQYVEKARRGESGAELRPNFGEDPQATPNRDGNTVNLDRELGLMAKNTIMYNVSAQLLSKKLKLLAFAVQGGR